MRINITKMGDGFVITENNETQIVFEGDDRNRIIRYLGSLMFSEFEFDSNVIQINIDMKTESFYMKDAKPVSPKPSEV